MSVYDAIVIGGGIAGVSTAYNLVREGAKTLLFDRQDTGRATDAGAGIISPYTGVTIPYRTEAQYHFTVKAAKYYPQLIEQLGAKQAGSTVYAECGILFVAVSEDELEAFEQARSKICKQLEQDGLSPESELPLLSSNEVRELFPTLAETKAAMLCRKAAQVDGRQLSQALYQAAEQQGLTVKDAGVEKLIIENQAVRGVVANGDTFFADKVAIAGGSWSPEFEEQCGVRIPVEPERGQIIHLTLPNVDTANRPIVFTFRHKYYMLSWPDSRIVVGATREKGTGFNSNSTVAGIHEILGDALRVAPGLTDASLKEVRTGLRPIPADEMPILGTVPNLNNLYLATGLGHSGLSIGSYVGKVVADTILGKEIETDIEPFNVKRFNYSDPK
jgi:D-amino-acid dehydrogenase